MRTTKNISIRMPVGEAREIEERAKASGLSINSYARALLNRERVDSAAAIALLHALVEAQHAEMLARLDEQQRENKAALDAVSTLSERFDKLKDAIRQLVERSAK